jgi:membrane associated rhomboid family serine protease
MLANLPPATRALLLINVAVFLLQLLTGQLLEQWFALWPPGAGFEPWQLVTYAFLHDPHNYLHILLNMFALFMFGTPVERYLGSRRFILYYFVCVVAAGLTQQTVAMLDHSQFDTLGASGGIFGLLLAFAMYFPHQRIMLLFPPIPLPAWLLVPLYGLAELYQGVAGYQPGVAHFAHLGGLAGGAAMILFWRVKDGARKA